MTAVTTDPGREARVAARFAELDDIKTKLAEVPDLYERRIALYLELREFDVPFKDIAEHTDASAEAVRVAVNKAKRTAAGNPITRRS